LLVWGAGWFLFQWFTLFILSTIFGESARNPDYLFNIYIGILVLFYGWALIDTLFNRFPVVQDRLLFGWKEVKDILLAIPRMTFSIVGNLQALILLSHKDKVRAWQLVCAIFNTEHATFHTLDHVVPNPKKRLHLLNILQIIRIINLHTSREEDFFYLVRSDQEDWVKSLVDA